MLLLLDYLKAGILPKEQIKIEKFRKEISRSLLLSEDQKIYWLQTAESLPGIALENILAELEKKNAIVDEYLYKALDNDKDKKILAELKQNFDLTKSGIVGLRENKEKEQAELDLDQTLKNL